MLALFLFALTLLVAVLLSDLASRSILSAAVLFLVSGFLAGGSVIGAVRLDSEIVSEVATLALFTTLFTDGMRAGVRDLRQSWRLPGRALLLGLPLSVLATALITHWLAGLGWRSSLLLGAVLAPTDPVFAGALLHQRGIPEGLRHLLNVESGINDGVALPLVLWLTYQSPGGAVGLALPLVIGIGIGIAVPLLSDRLERSRWLGANEAYHALAGFAVALLVLTIARLAHGNELLGAFAAGVTVISLRPNISQQFREFIGNLASVFKFAGIFIFGALLSPALVRGLGPNDYILALLILVAVRPVTLSVALVGSDLPARERVVAGWFGPKGFASVLYAVMVLQSGVPSAEHLFHVAALVITGSMVLHSSTDVLAARWVRTPV
jgi:NhaP-type Na+/H+ or K+/H+ antiporter